MNLSRVSEYGRIAKTCNRYQDQMYSQRTDSLSQATEDRVLKLADKHASKGYFDSEIWQTGMRHKDRSWFERVSRRHNYL